MGYRCADAAGDIYFFIVNLAERRSDVLVLHIDDVRAAMEGRKTAHLLKHAEIEKFNSRTRV